MGAYEKGGIKQMITNYTLNFLKKRGIAIYNNYGKRILHCVQGHKDYPKQDTKYDTQKLVFLNNPKPYTIPHKRLEEFGMKIVQVDVQEPFPSLKTVKNFHLVYSDFNVVNFGKLPQNTRLEFNPEKWEVRLIGQNVYDETWLRVDRKIKKIEKEENPQDNLFWDIIKKKEEKTLQEIKEITLGASIDGEIVCIPIERDPPRIGGCGEPGTGKTFFIHLTKDEFIDKEIYLCVELNDIKNETGDYIKEWSRNRHLYLEEVKFREQLSLINHNSKPQPIVFLHPNSDKLEDSDMLFPNELGFRVFIPFNKIMENPSFFSSIEKYKLRKSGDYLENLVYDENGAIRKDGLLYCKDLKGQFDYIDLQTKTKHNPDGVLPPASGNTIKNFLKTLWKTKIFDITNETNPIWKMVVRTNTSSATYFSYPWTICLLAGLSVSFEMKHIKDEPYYPILLKFIAKDIFDEKRNNPLLKNKNIMIYADEVPQIIKNKNSFRIIDEIMSLGRSDGIGFTLMTQFYDDIPDSMISKLSLFVCFKSNQYNENLKKDWFKDYPKMYDEISTLQKKECIICGDLILYRNGKRYSNNGRPIRMFLFPPASRHHPPPEVSN